ncbi:hypothetical protein Tco_0802261 [Tanacetum coccineum]|uniref:Uncharacterized protein n=1 Tax=Tanacetum coccineum TaxID=301880 RepID=A0ABQ4ZYG9_9ASTR
MGVSHDLRGDSRNYVPRSLPWRESFGRKGERSGGLRAKEEATSTLICSKSPEFFGPKLLLLLALLRISLLYTLGACIFTDRWRLDELAYGIPSDGPYQTNPPSITDIISSIRIDREGQFRRIRHEEEIDVYDYQILTREIIPTLKPLEFNLAYYMAKRMEWVTKQARLILPYGMLLTRLFKVIMDEYPELYNKSYVLYDRVMNPFAAQLERKPRRDRGTRRGRHSTSSSSAFDQPFSSYLNDDDDDGNDEGTSHESIPSPIRYINSLTNQVPQVFQKSPNVDQNMEPFYTCQTEIFNRQVQLRDEQRGGVWSIRKSLRRLWRNMRK